MKTIVRRSPLALTLAAGALATLSAPAHATPRSWSNAAGGAASTSTNWSPVGVPVAADVLSYGLAGAYSVTFNASAATDAQNNFSAGTVSISASSPHTTTGQFVAAHTGSCTVNLTGGQFSCGGTAGVAGGSALTGILNVTGPTSSLISTNSAFSMRVGNGISSNGTLNVLNGGLVQSAGGVLLGAFNSSTGTLLVSGVNGATHSQLVSTDAALGDLTIGLAGPGSLTIAAGGLVTIADDITVAPTTGFSGSMTIGSVTADTSIATIAGDLLVGRNTSVAAAGTGTVNVNAKGQLVVTGAINVGDPDGGTGTLVINSTSNSPTEFVRCHDLFLDPTNGVLDFRDGTLEVIGGTFTPASSTLNINGAAAGDAPVLKLTSGASLALDQLNVGIANSGQVAILNSSLSLSLVSIIGGASTGTGLLSCSGIGSTITHNTIDVGGSGTGFLSIHTSGTVTGLSANLGLNAGSQGTVTVDGASSSWTLGSLFLGGSSVASGGDGDLNVTNGGVVNVTDVVKVRSSGSLITLGNGIIHASEVELGNGSITGNGIIDAKIHGLSAVSTITASGGPLTLGKATNTLGILMDGVTLNVGAQTVTLLDADHARPGNVTLSGGTLIAASGLDFIIAQTLSGNGTVNADITNTGTGAFTATGAGLTFGGVVSGIGGGISGTSITFASGGGFTGSGNIAAPVNALTGSTITATGALQLGNIAVGTDACTIGGTLNTNANTVTLFDSVRPLITGTVMTSPGGTLTANLAGVQVKRVGSPIAAIRGGGTVSCPLFNNGLVSPGNPAGDRTQTLGVQLSYDQRGILPASPGTLEIDIEGTTPGTFDVVAVAGNAVLDGTLLINRLDGFMPPIGQQYTILTATSRTGTFPVVIGQGFTVTYNPTTVVLTFIGICDSADFDCDEDFGTDADIEAFFRCLGGVCPSNCGNDADFNNDGDFGTDADIEAFFRVLAGGSCF